MFLFWTPFKQTNPFNEMKSYAAMISLMDKDIGDIMELLKKIGLDHNTLVIFDSDNGPPINETTQFFNSNGALNGGKTNLYEGGIKVPLIAWWPEKIKPGRTSTLLTASWDFLPTACELAGIKDDMGIDGISFLPELIGYEQPEHNFLYWEFKGIQAVRKGTWKGIRYNDGNNKTGIDELYDLSSDQGEKNNLSDHQKELAKEMEIIMDEQHSPNKDFPLNY